LILAREPQGHIDSWRKR